MSFVQAGMLGALAALAVPILVHLMFRRRARPMDLGTLQFLKVVLRDNARKRRLKRYALLALRLAGVALIAMLFARPYLVANEAVDGRRLAVVLMDRSASMGLTGGKRPIDRAADEVRAVAARAGSGTHLEIAVFDRSVSPVASPAEAAKAMATPSFGGTEYGVAMAWARDVIVRSKASRKELHVLTDFQRAGLDRGDSSLLPSGTTVSLVDLGRSFPKNVGVIAVTATPESPRPLEPVKISATLRNAAPLPAGKVAVKLRLETPGEDAIEQDAAVDLDGGASSTVEFTTPALAAGTWRGQVEAITGDDLAFDDRRYFALAVAPPARVVLADGDPQDSPGQSETFFLDAALRLAPAGETYAKTPFDPRVVEAPAGLPDLKNAAVVVLANLQTLSAGDAGRLAGFVRKGGGLVVFTGDRTTADLGAALHAVGLGVGKVVGPESAGDRLFRLSSWDQGHPIFKPFADPEFGDLRRPAFTAITRVDPDASARVVARFRGGAPALIEKPAGKGRVLLFASSADRAWGDWPRGRMYLPMVHQMVAYAAGLSEGGKVRYETASGATPVGVVEADGVVRVTNPDPDETDTARCSPKEFAARFGFALPEAEPLAKAPRAPRGSADDRVRSDEIWPWLALGLVGVLLIEAFLANRTAA